MANRKPWLGAGVLLLGLLLVWFFQASPLTQAVMSPLLASTGHADTSLPVVAQSLLSRDSGQDAASTAYLPLVQRHQAPCVPAGQEIPSDDYLAGVRCCSDLSIMAPGRLVYPCDTPGEGNCDWNGCTVTPPCFCFQCSPCGNSLCEPHYGENACNCRDCDH